MKNIFYYKTQQTLELLFDKENNFLAINYLNKKSIIGIITIVKINKNNH